MNAFLQVHGERLFAGTIGFFVLSFLGWCVWVVSDPKRLDRLRAWLNN